MKYIFGPVPSRRPGRSLGIDLVPFKTCTYDCIYCQLGRTTLRTVERREWVPLDAVVAELKGALATRPDYITLSGSGDPTLYSRLDELIESVHALTDIPVAVLTNGSLLWQPEVRRQLHLADLIVPSLDAGANSLFQAVNRPHPEITFERMIEGLTLLRKEYGGAYWLEIFILDGLTAGLSEVRHIADLAADIGADRVQLNTVTRPPAEDFALGVTRRRMEELAALFRTPAEVIADFPGGHARPEFEATRDSVLQMIRRRPCTLEDVADGLGLHRNEAVKYIEDLISVGRIERLASGGKEYYAARPQP
ncbi:MAG TPA: radical SAM protein [Deltaproteobacteria bacterium]|nr:radical SAM protein [Deltaproteobacteria bacterium]